MIGNNKIFSDNIQNFTHNPFRRVDLKMPAGRAADRRWRQLCAKDCRHPGRDRQNRGGCRNSRIHAGRPGSGRAPLLPQRPYWQVYFDTNRVIREALAEAGFPAPMPAQNVVVSRKQPDAVARKGSPLLSFSLSANACCRSARGGGRFPWSAPPGSSRRSAIRAPPLSRRSHSSVTISRPKARIESASSPKLSNFAHPARGFPRRRRRRSGPVW